MGEGHPEQPERLRVIDRAMESEVFQVLARDVAPRAEFSAIARVHLLDYIEAIRAATPTQGHTAVDDETLMSPGSFEAALRSAGGAIFAVDEVMTRNFRNAFVATRPPGHHAEVATPTGFCFFNNAAIAARHAQAIYGAERVAIVDFDVHHGNGKQDIFWDDRTVMYAFDARNAALSGHGGDRGPRRARSDRQRPLRAGDGGEAFREAMEIAILPRISDFAPDLIVISAGLMPTASIPSVTSISSRRTMLGDAAPDGNRSEALRRPHRLGAGRRLRPRRPGALGGRACDGADGGVRRGFSTALSGRRSARSRDRRHGRPDLAPDGGEIRRNYPRLGNSELVHGGHDAVLELLFGCDADVAQHRAGELGEETLDEIEPGAVLGREGEFESAGRLLGEPSLGLLGDVRRMIVEDQLDRCVGRIRGIEELGVDRRTRALPGSARFPSASRSARRALGRRADRMRGHRAAPGPSSARSSPSQRRGRRGRRAAGGRSGADAGACLEIAQRRLDRRIDGRRPHRGGGHRGPPR